MQALIHCCRRIAGHARSRQRIRRGGDFSARRVGRFQHPPACHPFNGGFSVVPAIRAPRLHDKREPLVRISRNEPKLSTLRLTSGEAVTYGSALDSSQVGGTRPRAARSCRDQKVIGTVLRRVGSGPEPNYL